PEEYRWLATYGRGAVLELPMAGPREEQRDHYAEIRRETRYMYWSFIHWLPLVNGYTSYRPSIFWEVHARVKALPAPESFRYLQAIGVRHILVHPEDSRHGDIGALAREAVVGTEVQRFPDDTVALTLPDAPTSARVLVTVEAPAPPAPGARPVAVRIANPDPARYWVNEGQRPCALAATWTAEDGATIATETTRVLPPVALAPGQAAERVATLHVPD